jgi:hypothetical protein
MEGSLYNERGRGYVYARLWAVGVGAYVSSVTGEL